MAETGAAVDRIEIDFRSGGHLCAAWLYAPRGTTDALPCVVMAHGFGATREMSLAPYAERFAAAGLNVLLFDYRHFGASEGNPRQLISVRRQLRDYAAAIECARQLDTVDAARIAVWGTSFSGGHALVTAARDADVAAALCQCPMLDGLAALRNILAYAGIGQALKLTGHGLTDLLLSAFGSAHYIPIVGQPGSLAVMSTPDAEDGYRRLAPPGVRDDVAARIALFVANYRPVKDAGKVRCPVLVQICEHDSVAPPSAAEETVRRLGEYAEARRYPIGHFEPYFGEHHERSVSDQLEFLRRHLN